MDTTFLQARITATQAQIEAYETAITTVSSGTKSYTLDTGQNRVVVTRQDLSELKTTLDALYNRLAILEARLYGAAGYAQPGW